MLELEHEPQRALEAIVQQAELAVTQDKAEVICLGCGGMAGLDEQIRRRTGVPVVDGVTAAVRSGRGPTARVPAIVCHMVRSGETRVPF